MRLAKKLIRIKLDLTFTKFTLDSSVKLPIVPGYCREPSETIAKLENYTCKIFIKHPRVACWVSL